MLENRVNSPRRNPVGILTLLENGLSLSQIGSEINNELNSESEDLVPFFNSTESRAFTTRILQRNSCKKIDTKLSKQSVTSALLYLLPRLERDENKMSTSLGRISVKVSGCHAWLTNFLLELLFDRRFKLRFARDFMPHYWQ